ncbi:hypothetical protein B7463_g3769, partial [Scytalidium lignicola]
MLLYRSSPRKFFTPNQLVSSVQKAQPIRALRAPRYYRSASISAAQSYAGKKFAYPERLLVYHAGTGKTVFIGCLKVTTIFVFSFFGLVVAPAHWYSDDEPSWVPGAVVLSGIVPMLFVAYTSSSFVTYIHLRLPQFARYSRDMLMRYSKNLPKDADIDITTMNFIGKPRMNKMKVGELYPVKERFGLANYARDTREANTKRPWWLGKAVRLFSINGSPGRIREKGVWENIATSINKRQPSQSDRKNI